MPEPQSSINGLVEWFHRAVVRSASERQRVASAVLEQRLSSGYSEQDGSSAIASRWSGKSRLTAEGMVDGSRSHQRSGVGWFVLTSMASRATQQIFSLMAEQRFEREVPFLFAFINPRRVSCDTKFDIIFRIRSSDHQFDCEGLPWDYRCDGWRGCV